MTQFMSLIYKKTGCACFTSRASTNVGILRVADPGLKYSLMKKIMERERELGIEGDALLPSIPDLCASFQHALYIHIMKRVQRAFTFCRRTDLDFGHRLVVSGKFECIIASTHPYIHKDRRAMAG